MEGIYEEVWCVCRRRDGNRRREGESNKESTSVSLIVRTGKQQTGPASQRRTRSEDEKHSFCDDDGETLFQRRGTSKRNKQTEGGGPRQGRSWTRRYIPPFPPHPPPSPGMASQPTDTDCAQPGAVTHLPSDMCLLACSQYKTFTQEPLDETSRQPQQFVPVPRPSPFASHPQEAGKKVNRLASHDSAPAKCFQSACFIAAGQCHEPTVSPFFGGRRLTNRVGQRRCVGWKRNRPGV